MYKITKTYTNFNDEEVTETFYFNLTKAELAEMDISNYGLGDYIKKIVDSKDRRELINLFKELLVKSYGIKSEDGREFRKNQAIRDRFTSTNAYSEIFMELATDEEAAAKFVEGIMPRDIARKAIEAKN
jgi:hypothetical protein